MIGIYKVQGWCEASAIGGGVRKVLTTFIVFLEKLPTFVMLCIKKLANL